MYLQKQIVKMSVQQDAATNSQDWHTAFIARKHGNVKARQTGRFISVLSNCCSS